MKFRAKKDQSAKATIISFCILFAILIGESFLFVNFSIDYIIVFDSIILLIWLLVLWVYFGTSYKVENNKIYIRSGPFFKKIRIRSIKKIIVGKTSSSGSILGTARRGLVIYYSKEKKTYISPKSNSKFLEVIEKINSSIDIQKYERHILK